VPDPALNPDAGDPATFALRGGAALVTGAGGGIGAALAVGLARAGAPVLCGDLEPPAGVAGTIEGLGGAARAVALDVTDPASMRAAVGAAEADLGPLRFAVNCAGLGYDAVAADMELEAWQRMIDVNLTGVFVSCQAQARAMLERGRGAIVNIASMSGSIVNRDIPQSHYNSAKAGVIALTRSLAMEWAARGLRVNAVSPGYTATRMTQRPEARERVAVFERDTPLGRMASPQEIVGPVVFLLGDAASFCTGVDLLVDGGFTCW
jgi:NAD(P)-dependent dehydrogenase (short-subunit alcohol dehydrogenase family)